MSASIILIIMGILLLGWVIFCFILCLKRNKKIIENSDFKLHLKCEKCGMEYEAESKELMKTFFSKSRSTTKTQAMGPVLVNQNTAIIQKSSFALNVTNWNTPKY